MYYELRYGGFRVHVAGRSLLYVVNREPDRLKDGEIKNR